MNDPGNIPILQPADDEYVKKWLRGEGGWGRTARTSHNLHRKPASALRLIDHNDHLNNV